MGQGPRTPGLLELLGLASAPAPQQAPPLPESMRAPGTEPGAFEGALDVLLGMLGVPFTPETKANLGGQVIGAAMPLIGGLKAVTAAKGLKAADTAADVAPAVQKTIRAFHGSPHDFDKFDMSKIGTGEGAQAYGHGLYFAEREGVARDYRNKLGSMTPKITVGDDLVDAPLGLRSADNTPETIVAARLRSKFANGRGELTGDQVVQATQSDIQHALEMEQGRKGPIYESLLAQRRVLERMAEKGVRIDTGGRMYEVEIKADPEHLLDWDAPLSQQSDKVREGITQAYGNIQPVRRPDGTYSITSVDPDGSGRMLDYGFREPTAESAMAKFREAVAQQPGRLAYREIGNPERASSLLKQAGVPGLKYFDQGSRAAGEGSRNFVMFGDEFIDIAKKYGLAAAFGAMLAKQGELQRMLGQEPPRGKTP